ncbi:MAG: FAD-dependent oxidoreductase [Candidatus Methylacidiphilales bacterium]
MTTRPRRHFLKTIGGTVLGATLSRPCLRAQPPPTRILIIGGGIAGLGAVERLRNAGFHTVLIEARDRLGGRVWTHPDGLDLGASWIHGRRGNPLMELVAITKARTFGFDYEKIGRYSPKGQLSDEVSARIEANFGTISQAIRRAQRSATLTDRLSKTVNPVIAALPATERNGGRYAVNVSITHEYAADPSALSLAYYDHGADPTGGDLLLPDGYASLVTALGRPAETHLGCPVRKIEWRGDKIVVETAQGPIEGRAAIVTLPLGVLKSGQVQFSPELPTSHQTAIRHLGFGTLNKLFLRFPQVAWPREPNLFGFIGDGWWEEWVNFVPVNHQPVLLGFNAGSLAERSEAMSDQELVASAMKVLRAMFGASLPDPVQATATRWKRDPYSLGSYSSFAPGSSPQDRIALAAPIAPHLILAGEACSPDHPATVHGALISGRTAAATLMKSLGEPR